MSVVKENILNLTKKELEDFLKKKNIQLFRKNQIWNWLYVHGEYKFSSMHNLSESIKDTLEKNFVISFL